MGNSRINSSTYANVVLLNFCPKDLEKEENRLIILYEGLTQMSKIKPLLLLVALFGQIIGIIMLFVNILAAVFFYILYILVIVVLFIVLVIERKKEKEEDDRNDYRNY